jgi:NhaA family Na+:H+ antiporter
VFLTALAVIDDLGAILVIAAFYTTSLVFSNLFIALGIFGLHIILNRFRIHNLIPYLIGGTAMWYFMLQSGVHATITGLVIGKPLGIWLFSYIGVILGFSILPSDLKWPNIIGAGMLGGIGFTMSIFITLLAFSNVILQNSSKIAIIVASLTSGLAGLILLRFTLKQSGEIN